MSLLSPDTKFKSLGLKSPVAASASTLVASPCQQEMSMRTRAKGRKEQPWVNVGISLFCARNVEAYPKIGN